jgi:hypothetical protein
MVGRLRFMRCLDSGASGVALVTLDQMALKEMSLVDFVVGSLEKGEGGTDGDMTYRRFDLLKWKFNYGRM